jgi:hypothetical protein
MKFKKLGMLGATHILVPLLVVVSAGIIGSLMLVASHADPLSTKRVICDPGYNNSGPNSCVPTFTKYTGTDDGCGGNATHDSPSGVHVGRTKYGTGSVCKCNNDESVHYSAIPEPSITPNPSCITVSTASCSGSSGTSTQQAQMKSAGLKTNDYACALYIFNHESNYCSTRVEGDLSKSCPASAPSTIPECSRANSDCGYGICQSTPADKMAVEGSSWRSSITVQMVWCNAYAYDAYGNWQLANAHWVAHHNW